MSAVIGFNGTGDSCEAVSVFTAGSKGPHDGENCQWKSNTNRGGWVLDTEMGWMEFRPGDVIAKTESGFIAFTPRTNANFVARPVEYTQEDEIELAMSWEGGQEEQQTGTAILYHNRDKSLWGYTRGESDGDGLYDDIVTGFVSRDAAIEHAQSEAWESFQGGEA